jgi:spoIIIJ-associated protein
LTVRTDVRMRLGYTTGVPIQDYQAAAETIVHFLKLLTSEGKLRLRYRIVAGAGAVDPDGMEAREVYVELSGPDSPLLVERNGELLRAMEHVAAKLIRLESEEHDKVSFDAENFKALRARDLRLRAETAVDQVLRTKQPFAFAPSNSRERRLLHIALRPFSEVETESVGEGMQRMLVVFPAGYDRASYTPPPVPQRAAYGERGDRPAGRRADRDRDRGGDRGFCRR